MKYSNGFDLDLVLPALAKRVGWASDADTVVKFEGFHSLLTESNLRAVQPNASIDNAAFDTYRQNLTKDVALKAVRNVFSGCELSQQALLYTRFPGSSTHTIANTGDFRGILLNITPSFQLAHQVTRAILYFDAAVTFNLYLFREGKSAAVATQSVTTLAGEYTEVDLTNFYLKFEGTGRYYLGYFQADLGAAKAIAETVNRDYSLCHLTHCNVTLQPASAATVKYEGIGYSEDAYGINAEVHTFSDYTKKILSRVSAFDEIIGLQMTYHVLEMITTTTRSNERQRILSEANHAIELKHYLYGAVPVSGAARTKGLNDILSFKTDAVRRLFFPRYKMQVVSC